MPEKSQEREGREAAEKEMFEDIVSQFRQSAREREKSGVEWLENQTFNLPEKARRDLHTYQESLEHLVTADGKIPTPEQSKVLTGLVAERIRAFEYTYTDRRFTVGKGERMLKDEYAKELSVEWISRLMDEAKEPRDLERIARISLDANGLKAVNDYSTHERGTEYLQRIAEELRRPDGPVQVKLQELGLEAVPVTGGGDEYGIILRSGGAIPQATLDEVLRTVRSAVEGIDVSDLIDFDDAETRGKATKSGLGEVPSGFRMRASVSAGAATLLEGMNAAMSDRRESKRLKKSEPFSQSVWKLMGGTWDAADTSGTRNKEEYKAALAKMPAGSPENFLSKLMQRTSEAVRLSAENDALREQAEASAVLEQEESAIDSAVDAGTITKEQAYDLNRARRREFKAQAEKMRQKARSEETGS